MKEEVYSKLKLIAIVSVLVCTMPLIMAILYIIRLFLENKASYKIEYIIAYFAFSIALVWTLAWGIRKLLKWTTIKINEHSKQIIFIKPLQFKNYSYNLAEIKGFYRTSYFTKWCYLKVLGFKTLSGKAFYLTDFETANLRKIEKLAEKHLSLLEKTTSNIISDNNNPEIISTNLKFDIEQAISIRFGIYCWQLFVLFVIACDLDIIFPDGRDVPLIFNLLTYALGIYGIVYLFYINKVIDKNKSELHIMNKEFEKAKIK